MSPLAPKSRLDQALVSRGLIETRAKARDAILQGSVSVDGAVATKPGLKVGPDAKIALSTDASPFVSRAGRKLAHALDHFGIDPKGLTALDIGASTGGFTDVLLKRGATHVTAIDVGHGQLRKSLRDDPRVTSIEKLNARDIGPDHLPSPPDLIVCDVSFIGLRLALPPALSLAAPGAVLIALIKPQFEVGRENVGKGGVVTDPELRTQACRDIETWLECDQGWSVAGIVPSPIAGADGNREYLIAARKRDDQGD